MSFVQDYAQEVFRELNKRKDKNIYDKFISELTKLKNNQKNNNDNNTNCVGYKIKRFKLRDGVTKDDLLALKFKSGGTWIKEDAELYKCRIFEYKPTDFEYSINIAFGNNISEWNDFDNIIIIDEDFLQPYTPFYGDNFGKEVNNFPSLENVIQNYNKFMSSLGIFEEIKD